MSNVTQQQGKKKVGINSVISWGATVVIIGLMFKILHLTGGAIMIAVGLGTESILFFILGFQAMDIVGPTTAAGDAKQPDSLGDLLSSAINPKVVEKLTQGFAQFTKTVETVNTVANAAPITQNMLKEMETATGDLKKFRDQMGGVAGNFEQFGKAMSGMGQITGSVQSMMKDFEVAGQGMKAYANNINSMNASFDQFNKTLQAINSMTASSQAMLKEFEAATNGMKSYNKALTDLSRVYTAQLEAFRKN